LIVMKCLEKDRTRRYETANGLAADIQRHINNEPVIARPPSAAYRFQKAFRRNKLLFTAGTVIVVALVLGVIGTTIGLLRAEKQRQAAAQKQAEAEAERQRAEAERQRADTQAKKASESEQHSRRLLCGERECAGGSPPQQNPLRNRILRFGPPRTECPSVFREDFIARIWRFRPTADW
jgi:hypothetical protein